MKQTSKIKEVLPLFVWVQISVEPNLLNAD